MNNPVDIEKLHQPIKKIVFEYAEYFNEKVFIKRT